MKVKEVIEAEIVDGKLKLKKEIKERTGKALVIILESNLEEFKKKVKEKTGVEITLDEEFLRDILSIKPIENVKEEYIKYLEEKYA